MTQDRSADSGILGFTYQFVQTAIRILSLKDSSIVFTVEGIEDLDINSASESSLVQYKYHAAKQYTPSTIDKPIALMFKHFVENYKEDKPWDIKYILFCYFGKKRTISSEKETICISSSSELNKILGYANATKILSKKQWTEAHENEFLNYLKFESADEFDESINVLTNLLSGIFNISVEESEALYFSNAIYYINKLAINKDIESRKITRQQFIDHLRNNSQKIESTIIERLYGKQVYIKRVKKYLTMKNVKPNTYTHVFHISNINVNTARFIIDLAKKFVVRNNKRDVHPLTIIVNSNQEDIKQLKTELLKINLEEKQDLIFNDGYEMYHFNSEVFNHPPLILLQNNKQRIEKVSYNYRILSYQIYQNHKNSIVFENPHHFIVNNAVNLSELSESRQLNMLHVANIQEEDILQLFGG
ncbi:hypothetical protein QUF86_06135 [Peribacillus sp. NJ11]|uniref:hypothetical protein n=1 Tax=Peribacillus sp. NJ11 TaxID=3055861 RepID=UPI0025A03252|nr:hypothetical protein [Peribacillus sp. NJ11]MDM5220332.1 hypothetical protein [Peribacillus sp. NJ11]